MRTQQTGALAAALILGAPMLAGCGHSSAEDQERAPREVRLGYFANITHAQAVLGVDSGEFRQAIAPAKLTTRVFNAGPSLIEALFAGEIDVGYIGPGPALSGFEKSRGEGLMVIAGAAANGVAIIARPESGINSMADLPGKRIATPQLGNTQDISAKHYLIHQLGQANTVNVLAIPNAEQLAMMSRGQIDAAWAPEPWAARLELEAGGKLIAEERDFWPQREFMLTLIIARPEFLRRHPDLVKRLLEVHRKWTRRLQDAPHEQVPKLQAAMLALTGKSMSEELLSRALSRVTFIDEPLAESLEAFAQWSLDLGFARSKPDLRALVDTTLLDAASNAAPTGSEARP
jgi:NitT/TauT family transport system substrate-binding protein